MVADKALQKVSIWTGAFLGAFSSLALIGLLALGDSAYGFPFVPFDIFDWMSRTLPGGLIAFVIRTMVMVIAFLQGIFPIGDTSTVAKLAEQTIAIIQLVGGGAVFGMILAWIANTKPRSLVFAGIIGGLVLLTVTLAIEAALGLGGGGLWLAILFVAWGWGLARLIERVSAAPEQRTPEQLSRKQFLTVSGAGLTAAALGAWGVSRLFGEQAPPSAGNGGAQPVSPNDPFGGSLTSGPAASPSPDELAARSAAVQGTRSELTANEDFYRIDINTRAPDVDGAAWRLRVTGLVDRPLELTLDEIRAMPSQTQILTMQCISNNIGGDLTSSSRWTGVRFKDLLDQAGIQPSAAGAYITSTDGFYEYVVMEDIMDERTLLVYNMNGVPLPEEHGFPLRIYIPDRYGMKQPKWIENIELIDGERRGYWVERGWSKEARPQTVSVVDTVAVDPETGMAITGGIAWAGGRGISRVEVQVDSAGWNEAELIAPPLSPLNWMLWRYEWPHEAGRHTVEVRTYDTNGLIQDPERRSTRPNGATGIHSVTVNL
jgi:DMSO/TMAO reductase YedYZ molybdopterin-dependent catalytic subunit